MTHLAAYPIHWHTHNSQVDTTEIIYYETLEDARAALDDDAQVWRDEIGIEITGNAEEGYDCSWDRDSHSHWRLYVQECTEPECTEEE